MIHPLSSEKGRYHTCFQNVLQQLNWDNLNSPIPLLLFPKKFALMLQYEFHISSFQINLVI